MYLPTAFARPGDEHSAMQLIAEAPFATWVHTGADETFVNHLPIIIDSTDARNASTARVLMGHLARANPVWQSIEPGASIPGGPGCDASKRSASEAHAASAAQASRRASAADASAADASRSLLVFHGPHHYVSPAWYPSKAVHHKAVPTWNYAVVHISVTPRIVHDPAACRRFLAMLTKRHESAAGSSWTLDDAPADFIDALMQAIVVIEYRIDAVQAKWKLGQNRPAADQRGVREALDRLAGNGDAMAAALNAWAQRLASPTTDVG